MVPLVFFPPAKNTEKKQKIELATSILSSIYFSDSRPYCARPLFSSMYSLIKYDVTQINRIENKKSQHFEFQTKIATPAVAQLHS